MHGRKKLPWIFLLATPLFLMLVLGALLAQATTAHALECQTCHDQLASIAAMPQYNTDEIVDFRNTLDIKDAEGVMPLMGWSITSDLPNWNALIDERLLILGANQ